ncbi:hypothetical protein [Microcoleus sp. B7-D4]|uniref:hypothetical protein n=1 Tax=Microcoleus sp. B7-D4 TaxID=2818696 RepID=UPI002FD20505
MTYSMFSQNNIDALQNHIQEIQKAVASDEQLIPTISYWSLQKSLSNLQGLTQLYFPLRGVSEGDIPQFMPLFIFVEATIYQIDEEYENHINTPQFISKHISVLQNVLSQLNLFDNEIAKELEEGLIYYRLEQKFCLGARPTQDDIDKASLFKCYDIGILQRILLKIINQPYDEEFLSMCQLFCQICKICTDIEDYKKDVERNVINTYRMFVRLYGKEAPQQLLNYMTGLNIKLQHQIKVYQKKQPDLAQKFIDMQNTYVEYEMRFSKRDFIDGLVIPEISEPILEKNTLP